MQFSRMKDLVEVVIRVVDISVEVSVNVSVNVSRIPRACFTLKPRRPKSKGGTASSPAADLP